MPDVGPITRPHHILQLLVKRTSRQLLWVLAAGLVAAGYVLLWAPSLNTIDEAITAWRATTGIGLTVAGGLLGAILGFTQA
mgnify:CR=1 FL=1